MLLSCYFIVLIFDYNSVITLFIYLSLFIIIILFRLNHFIYLHIIYFYLKNDEFVKLIFLTFFQVLARNPKWVWLTLLPAPG